MSCGIRPIGGGAIGSGSGGQSTFAVPIADIQRGAWSSSTGTDLYEAVNEQLPDDTSEITSELDPVNDVSEFLLEPLTDPGVDFGHLLKYRYKKVGAGTADIIVRLKQGATTISTFTHNDISSSYTLAEQVIADAEAATITDYTDLRVEFTAIKA
jgi:hypothetical protein